MISSVRSRRTAGKKTLLVVQHVHLFSRARPTIAVSLSITILKKTYGAGLLQGLIDDIGWSQKDLKRLKLIK